MSSTVFILGAGASKRAGAPLMAEFLDTAHDLWRLESRGVGDAFETVFEAISKLQSVHSKASLDIHNVESVFAAFEMAKTLQAFADYSSEQIEGLISAMRQVIVATIEKTLKFPAHDGQFPSAPEPYDHFATAIRHLMNEALPQQKVAVLTFNYDMAVDFAFMREGLHVDYGLDDSGADTDVPFLKLHGSLNWASCLKCEAVVPWDLTQYFGTHTWRGLETGQRVTLEIGSQLKEFKHCGENVAAEPVLVPPTWNKTEYHRTISHVWARAASELSDAENIFVIGYSLPSSDEFFRYLYALGTVGKELLKRFWVFNPDNSGDVKGRFQQLLGPGAQARFEYFPVKFKEAIDLIKEQFPGRA